MLVRGFRLFGLKVPGLFSCEGLGFWGFGVLVFWRGWGVGTGTSRFDPGSEYLWICIAGWLLGGFVFLSYHNGDP